MSYNRKMTFVADIEEKELKKQEQIRKEQEEVKRKEEEARKEKERKLEEEKKRQEEREELIFQFQRTQQNLYTQNLDKKREFIKKIDELTIKDKSSCLIGVFGMDFEKIRKKQCFYNFGIRNLDLGLVEYKNGKSDIYNLILLSIWLQTKSQVENFAYENIKANYLNIKAYLEKEKKNVLNDYDPASEVWEFARYVFSRLKVKKDRMILWIKLYDFDFELIDKIYKIENPKLRIIVSTFWDIDVLKSKLEMEKYPAEKVFNQYFSYNGIKTYIEV